MTTPVHTKVRLPKLTLPHFNGNLTKWTAFWDSYESAIYGNDALSEVDKFNYLRSLLESPAFEAIRGLTLSSANYQDAISILKKRFGNRQLIVSKHMETLLNIEQVTSDQKIRGLRKLHNDVEANTRSLKALGVEPETYGSMLASVLLGKLPNELRLIVSRKTSDAELTLSSLQGVMEEELAARERTVNLGEKVATPSQGQPHHRKLLKLDAEGKLHLSIAAFGAAREEPKVCAIVKIGMELKGYSHLYPSLLVVPMICEPLIGQPILNCIEGNPHLASLELADVAVLPWQWISS